jgi:hypothetical protein
MRLFGFALIMLLALTGSTNAATEPNESPQQQAAALIQFFRDEAHIPVITCGSAGQEYYTEQGKAQQLVAVGNPAIPLVENALAAMELHDGAWPFTNNAWWLLHVYARLKGPAAFPLLRRMRANRKFDVPPPWAEPKEPIELDAEMKARRESVSLPANAVIDTAFADFSGRECGKLAITFAIVESGPPETSHNLQPHQLWQKDPSQPGRSPRKFEGFGSAFLVDNADIGDVLLVIGRCAGGSAENTNDRSVRAI